MLNAVTQNRLYSRTVRMSEQICVNRLQQIMMNKGRKYQYSEIKYDNNIAVVQVNPVCVKPNCNRNFRMTEIDRNLI